MELASLITEKRKELNVYKTISQNQGKLIYQVVGFISNNVFNYDPG